MESLPKSEKYETSVVLRHGRVNRQNMYEVLREHDGNKNVETDKTLFSLCEKGSLC